MRNHFGKLVLVLLLASLTELGCAQAGAVPIAQDKNPATKATKPGNTSAPGDKTAGPSPGKPSPKPAPSEHDQPPAGGDGASKPAGNDSGSISGTPPDQQQLASWLSDPKVVGLIGLLTFLGLALHIAHILTQSRFKKEFAELHGAVQMLSQRVSMAGGDEKNARAGASNELTQRLNRHRQGLDQLGLQTQEIEQRLIASERQAAEASTAVALAAHMAAEPRINQALDQAANQIGEADRATAIKIVGRYDEILGANEARVKPLIQETRALGEWLNGRSDVHPELVNRTEGLLQDALKFERWHADASGRRASLQRGSVSDRYSAFAAKQGKLVEQFNTRAISIVDYVKGYGELVESHFPAGADSSVSIAPGELEAELRAIAAGVPDCLMDWFDRLSQLQSQAAQAAIDAETAARLTQIHRTAKDVLGKFDIQPEEIQIGVTAFDRRLHDASLITQSPRYPANTVVGVQQYGFRKLSTGDVLRRPKVIVAGVGAAS